MLSWVVVGVEDRVDDQQRRGLAGRPGDRQDRPGDDPAERRRQDHVEDRPPARDAERVGGLAQACRARAAAPPGSSGRSAGSITIASATAPAKPDSLLGLARSGRRRTGRRRSSAAPASGRARARSTRPSRDPLPANSVRYRAVSTPIGIAITVAQATITPCRRSRLAIPPPTSPTGFWVMNDRLSTLAPRLRHAVDDDHEDGDHGQRRRDRQTRDHPADHHPAAEVAGGRRAARSGRASRCIGGSARPTRRTGATIAARSGWWRSRSRAGSAPGRTATATCRFDEVIWKSLAIRWPASSRAGTARRGPRCRRRSPARRRSPRRARVRARARVAAATPDAVVGSTTPRITSQRVAPSASAPSFSSRGTVRNRSRLSEAMIGRIITVSTSARGEDAEPGRLRRPEDRDEAERAVQPAAPRASGRTAPARPRPRSRG